MDQFLGLIRDAGWQFFFGLAGILVAIFVFWRQRQRKALVYEILLSSSLLQVSDKLKTVGNLQILLDGTPIEGLSLYAIKIANNGNVPIIPNDFVSPIRIGFPDCGQVVRTEIVEAASESLKVDMERGISVPFNNTIPENTGLLEVVIAPVLLNPKDWFTIQVMVSQPIVAKPIINGRIVGVKGIRESSHIDTRSTIERGWRDFLDGLFGRPKHPGGDSLDIRSTIEQGWRDFLDGLAGRPPRSRGDNQRR